jgi:response regulator RpfG family c-di-GMP phosphodiesterase
MLPTVLVIDDFQPTLDLYYDLLNSDQYELELSTYAFEQPAMIKLLKPSLIILDFKVYQRVQCWQWLDRLKLNPYTSSIPVILCTPPMQDIREQENYLKEQGIVVFYKPFIPDRLRQEVRHILNLSAPETK